MKAKTLGPWQRGPGARILATPIAKLASHWLFQGMTYMEPTERAFKVATEVVAAVTLYPLFRRVLRRRLIAGLAATLASHTLDVVVNGQILVALRSHLPTGNSPDALEQYARGVGDRLSGSAAVEAVLAYGSLARGELASRSDIDIRVLRRPGSRNGLEACARVVLERVRGLVAGVPIDIYVWDSPHRARAMRADESPVVLAGEFIQTHERLPPPSSGGSMGRVVFLRGARTDRPMGSADVEVIPGLGRLGWTTLLVASGPAGTRYRSTLDTATVTAWSPPIPVVGAIVANLHATVLALAWHPNVLVVNPGMAIAGALCALLAPAATVVTDVRSILVETKPGFRQRVWEVQHRLACNLPRLRGLTAITPGTLDVLRTEYRIRSSIPVDTWGSGARLDLFHPGVEPVDLTTVGLAAESTVFVYHGGLSADRGLVTLMNAFARVHATHPGTSLMLLGDGPAVADLRKRAAALGVTSAVAFLSTVPMDRVPEYLAAADIGVIPLPDVQWWRVSSPLKLYEYLAMGMTVIATDIEAHRTVGGILLCRPSEDGIADAMARAVELHPEPVAVELARYSWDRQAERLSSFLQSARRA